MTIRVHDFGHVFVNWLRHADYTLSLHGEDRVAIAPRGGEMIYFLAVAEGGWIRVTRSDRGGAPGWEFDAASLDVIERHFTTLVGDTVRRREGLPGTVRVPFRSDELAPGATLKTLVDWEFSNVEEVAVDGRPIGRFRHISGRVHPAVEASHYCSGSMEQVQASFLDPEGKPLFGLG